MREARLGGEDYLYVIDLGTGQKREVEPSAVQGRHRGREILARRHRRVLHIGPRQRVREAALRESVHRGENRHLRPQLRGTSSNSRFRGTATISLTSPTRGAPASSNLVDLRAHQDLDPAAIAGAGRRRLLELRSPTGKRLAFGFARRQSAAATPTCSSREQPAGGVDRERAGSAGPRQVRAAAPDAVSDLRPAAMANRGKMPLYIYEPAEPGPHPVLIVLHGGPEAQFRPSFDPWIQYVVNELGFAVLAPNVRGSSGYGKSYRRARQRRCSARTRSRTWARCSCGSALDSRFDAKHVMVSGDGYGGYLALAALVNYGERLRGAVDLARDHGFHRVSWAARRPYRAESRRARSTAMSAIRTRALYSAAHFAVDQCGANHAAAAHRARQKRLAACRSAKSDQLVNRLRSRGGRRSGISRRRTRGTTSPSWQNRDAYYRAFAQFLESMR